jgi:putative transcriptional regulator
VRCYAGYAGWGPGQLDGEIALGSWFVVDRRPDDLWSDQPDALWAQVLRRQPAGLAQYANSPLDPSSN